MRFIYEETHPEDGPFCWNPLWDKMMKEEIKWH